MKTEHVYLDELNPYSKGYKVKVKVIEKNRARESPQKKVTYQSMLFQDDKGHKMKAALFGEQVDGYKDVIVYNGEYEIANAIIKPVGERWKTSPEELDYQMSFGKNTIVQPLDGIADLLTPKYVKLSSIPKFAAATERFDVLAVALFVEDAPGRIVKFGGRSSTVREILLIDESIQHPLLVSAWNELAEKDCEDLKANTTFLPIVGFTALKPSTHKGFSLTTTMSTAIVIEPPGEQAKELQSWVSHNRLQLNKTRLKVLAAKCEASAVSDTTISNLLSKKAADVIQDEKYNLEVTIPEPNYENVNAYIGCSNCGKATEAPLGKYFPCEACHKPNCTAAPKVTFKCEVSDNTGTFPLTFFTNSCEKLLDLSAADVFHLRHNEDIAGLCALEEQIEAKTINIQVAPSTSLTKNRVLQWVLHHINSPKAKAEERSPPKAPPPKRRLILTAGTSSSEDFDTEAELENIPAANLATESDAVGDDGSPSPILSPRTPFDK